MDRGLKMAINARQYREHLYRVRSHPEDTAGFVDNRDSFGTVYFSVLPFLLAEYFAESTYEMIPSGLVFPVGYLLFWAFFYTYYRPGFLENHLTQPKKFEVLGIPAILMGVVIWFIKVTVVELIGFVVHHVLGIAGPSERIKAQAPRPAAPPPLQGRAGGPTYRAAPFRFATPQPPSLPGDVVQALKTLGLSEQANWGTIHQRYRELAKKYHPDLNPEITIAGRRFITYDQAYRKLATVKTKYFSQKM